MRWLWGSRRRLHGLLSVVALLAGCAAPTPPWLAVPVYRQSDQIVARYYPDPDQVLPTPAFNRSPAHALALTTNDELTRYISALAQKTPNLHLREMGRSALGRPIPMMVFSTASSGSAKALRTNGKPTVWIHAQQHGDEPAAGEAALALAAELSTSLSWVLERLNIVIVPRVNPDGARLMIRHTTSRFDPNRDSMRMILAESRALRRANLAYAPIVTIDVHEYNPARANLRDLGERGYLEAHDMMVLGALNPNVDPALRSVTDRLFVARAMRAVSANGYSTHRYYIVRRKRINGKLQLRSGSAAARIGRNYHGLIHQVSVLLESRGINLGTTSFKRRVHSQLVALRALVRSAVENADHVQQVIARARAAVVARGRRYDDDDLIVIHSRPQLRPDVVPFIDIAAQKRKLVAVDYHDYAQAKPWLVRRRPTAYILRPQYELAARTLQDLGVRVERLEAARVLDVETYRVITARPLGRLYEGTLRRQITTSVRRRLTAIAKGSFVVPMDQPLANLAALALEPEGRDSFFCFGLLPSRKGSDLAVTRYLAPKKLETGPAGF